MERKKVEKAFREELTDSISLQRSKGQGSENETQLKVYAYIIYELSFFPF